MPVQREPGDGRAGDPGLCRNPGLSGNSAAEVTFQVREDASGVTKVTCNTLEQGSQIGTQEQPVSTATFTYALSGGQVTGSAGHDCPSLRFRDLKPSGTTGIDRSLNKGLVNGMTEDLFSLRGPDPGTVCHHPPPPGRLRTAARTSPLPTSGPAASMKRPCGGAYEKGYINGTSKAPSLPSAPLTRRGGRRHPVWRMAGHGLQPGSG